jgi:hypothetical protein
MHFHQKELLELNKKKYWQYWGLNQDIALARQVLYHLIHASAHFSYFSNRISCFYPGQPELGF